MSDQCLGKGGAAVVAGAAWSHVQAASPTCRVGAAPGTPKALLTDQSAMCTCCWNAELDLHGLLVLAQHVLQICMLADPPYERANEINCSASVPCIQLDGCQLLKLMTNAAAAAGAPGRPSVLEIDWQCRSSVQACRGCTLACD